MSAGLPSVEPARPDDLPAIERLLERCELPTEDIDGSSLAHFLVVRSDALPVGVVGLEPYPPAGLLRSLAVDPGVRGRALGGALVAAIERRASELGLTTLYLLTISAAPFFAARGYTATARAAVPDAVRSSAEFRALCPDTAVCLRRSLLSS